MKKEQKQEKEDCIVRQTTEKEIEIISQARFPSSEAGSNKKAENAPKNERGTGRRKRKKDGSL